jgi:hypothetical protein
MHGREEKYKRYKNLEGKDHMEGCTVFNDGRVWTGLIWLRTWNHHGLL